MTDTTPEEKLLNLIKKDRANARFKKDLKIFTKVNVILIGFILAAGVVFLADVFVFNEKIPEPPAGIQREEVMVEPVSNDTEEAIGDMPMDAGKDVNIRRISTEEIKGKLNLLGIVIGDNNQAIIEDKTLGKTFFLYKGDRIGEFKVEDIKSNRVILDYKGNKIELNI